MESCLFGQLYLFYQSYTLAFSFLTIYQANQQRTFKTAAMGVRLEEASLRANSPFLASKASRQISRDSRFRRESPFAGHSRVTFRNSHKWRACSRLQLPLVNLHHWGSFARRNYELCETIFCYCPISFALFCK